MKKIITTFICLILLMTTFPSAVFASEYESLIDHADLVVIEDEEYLHKRINYIKEYHDYNITLVSGEFESNEAFIEYGDNFSDYDSTTDGTILLCGEYEDSYSYYSIPYGKYSDLLNEAIFAEFEEFDASAETYAESYEMYITLVQIFLDEQENVSEVVNEDASQETSEITESAEPLFDVSLVDEVGVLSDKNKEYFERRIQSIFETYNYRITLTTKDFDYAQSYPDFEKYEDDLTMQADEETSYSGSVIVFGTKAYNDFYFTNGLYGEYSDMINAKMSSFYEIQNYAREDEKNLEDMCFYVFDTALNWVESVLEKENKPPVKSVEEFIGIGETIDGFDPMIDAVELFSETEEEQLFARIEEIHNDYDFDVTIMTMNEIPDDSYDLREYFDWYEGLDPTRDGLVVGVNMNEANREFSISARNFGSVAFTEDAHEVVHKEVPPLLTDGEYFKSFHLFLDYTEEFLETAKAGEPYKMSMDITTIVLFIVLVPLLLAASIAWLIVKFIFVAQMKTAVIKTQAKDFMKKDSLVLTVNSDMFTHETETREYDPPSENKGGGGDRTESDGYGGGRSGSSSSF